jgi:hypothetical protein
MVDPILNHTAVVRGACTVDYCLCEDIMPIEDIQDKKKYLAELATVLNSFKSEAVQLRLLEHLLGNIGVDEGQVQPNGKPKSSPRRRPKQPKPSAANGGSGSPAKKKSATSGTGAVATVAQLVEGDFFKKPRTIGDIIEHCKHNLARSFKANEISGKLGQLVRSKHLTRAKNADHQYEYKKP